MTWVKISDRYPEAGEVVWVFDHYYDGVTTGYFDGYDAMRTLPGQSDDCDVTHWMPMERPEPPYDSV